ncbi:MAG: TlpA disulfide reductase family protein [Acidimicrobiia bacterium]|nr:MAG: TlpA disulfide reductase family protein [Acidimicrobiia bacterium]
MVVIGLLVVLTLTRPTPEDAAAASGQASKGAPAPSVEMVDFDGEQVTLSQYSEAGMPVVLNFWASWCPFCIAEMPDFERVSQATLDEVAFIGVNLQDDQSLATSLAEETGVTYRLTRDPQGVVYAAFGGIGMPTTVFVDASGIVREVVTGQLSESQLRSKIAEYFSVDV